MERITIAGPPFKTGEICGSLFREVLSERTRELSDKDRKELEPESAAFKEILSSFAPAWLEELEGIESAAGIPVDNLIMLNCSARPAQCTSVLSVKAGAADNILHKNRDQKPLPQFFFIKHAGKANKYLAGGSIGDIGIAYFLNEKGLSGANNSGSITRKDEIAAGGLTDCHLMRLVAENASSCEEALAIIKKTVDFGVCGSAGNGRGMIFLFTDPGKGLIIENTSKSLVHKFVNEGVFCRANDYLLPGAKDWIDFSKDDIPSVKGSRLRLGRAREILRGAEITPGILMRLSRDAANYPLSINNDAGNSPTMTLSSFISVVKKEITELLSSGWVCHGNPSYSAFFPCYTGGFSSHAGYCGPPGRNGGLFSKRLRISDRYRAELEARETASLAEEKSFLKNLDLSRGAGIGELLDARNLEKAETALGWQAPAIFRTG